jgi:hypothetical protein
MKYNRPAREPWQEHADGADKEPQMLQQLESSVEPMFSDAALADSFAAEQEHAEQCRAELAAEADTSARDFAASLLAETLPLGWYWRLYRTESVTRLSDGSIRTDQDWKAYAARNGVQLSAGPVATPGEAAMDVVRQYRAIPANAANAA